MPTPDEQARNVESSATGEILESMNALPSLATASTFQETTQRLFELLATVGHEFRTPLMVINGYTSTLLRQAQQLASEEQREFLQEILQAGQRLETMTERLLELAQLETGAFQLEYSLVDVASLACQAITLAQQYESGP